MSAAVLELPALPAMPARRASFGQRLLANRSFVIGGVLVGLVVVLAALAGVLAPFDPLKGNFRARMVAPGMAHWMGTDHFGRDILSRVLFGARISLMIGCMVALITGVAAIDKAMITLNTDAPSTELTAIARMMDGKAMKASISRMIGPSSRRK